MSLEKTAEEYLADIPMWARKKNSLEDIRAFLERMDNPDEKDHSCGRDQWKGFGLCIYNLHADGRGIPHGSIYLASSDGGAGEVFIRR